MRGRLMKNYYDRTWKIGELARMFDINVQLLRHYDKEGLLVPEIRNPHNNWRSYKYDQIYPLGMIRFLRQLDCSLEDIGSFMPGRNPDNTEKYLRRRMKMIRANYEKLLKMESVMNDRFAMVNREMKYAAFDQVFVCSEEDIYYIEIGGIETWPGEIEEGEDMQNAFVKTDLIMDTHKDGEKDGVILSLESFAYPVMEMTLSNQSGRPFTYGSAFVLETNDNGEWKETEKSREMMWTMEAYELADGESVRLSFDLSLLGDLYPDRYRVGKEGIMAEFRLVYTE